MKRNRRIKRNIRRRVLIMCEGKTEKNYFQAIKEDEEYQQALSALNPQVIAAKNPTPKKVIKEAIKRVEKALSEENPYDEVWVVFDHDFHGQRKKAYDEAVENNFGIAFSAIAFEMWFLAHFVRKHKAFQSAGELIKELKRYYLDYQKAKRNDFKNLKKHLNVAFHNSVILRKSADLDAHITDRNPWLDVDQLVRRLTNL